MDDINYTAARFIFDVIQTLFLIGVAIYTWIVNRSKANRAAIDKVSQASSDATKDMKDKIDELSKKIELQEKEISHLPDHSDMARIHEKVNKTNIAVNELKGELAGINRQMTIISDHLLNKSKQ